MNRLMKLRNSHPAFDGNFNLLETDEHKLGICWEKNGEYAQLLVDFKTFEWKIKYTENKKEIEFE